MGIQLAKMKRYQARRPALKANNRPHDRNKHEIVTLTYWDSPGVELGHAPLASLEFILQLNTPFKDDFALGGDPFEDVIGDGHQARQLPQGPDQGRVCARLEFVGDIFIRGVWVAG
ncbi:hypothetical protein MTO96_018648 [Rhipicephalus appendiculatus]